VEEQGSRSPEGELPRVVVITGMSGAGRSTAIHTFEDRGYFCIDNLPPSMIRQVVELAMLPGSRIHNVAVVCDVRGLDLFDQLIGSLDELEEAGYDYRLLFLEASADQLVRRFSETRRPHPLDEGEGVAAGIEREREMLCDVRGRASLIIDTTTLRPPQLRDQILREFLEERRKDTLAITVSSFGFKYGAPLDADIQMDVRFIPNPFYDLALRDLSGLDDPVREFVMTQPQTQVFLEHWTTMLAAVAPKYLAEGKTHLSIAMGCTGGMHRSVALAEETATVLRDQGFNVTVTHRDLGKDRRRG
jgi:UPF0042 nucleotide-binding protein